jgi:hypothetical protein
MTDRDLKTLVREHVRADEPPFLMAPDTSIALGRRTLVRRRARRGFAGMLVAAAAIAALPLMPWSGGPGGGDKTGIDPATAAALRNYDARRMPAIIDEHVRATLGDGLDGLGAGVFRASDDQGVTLPPRYYDKASGMSVSYGAHGDARQVVVSLMHSRSEAEGGARKICKDDLAAGYAFACTVGTSSNGDTVTTRVMAVRMQPDFPDATWGAVTREELRTGVPVAGNPSQKPIDPSEVYFIRDVESVHSETFLTSAQEIVKAPSFEGAQQAFKIPVEDLAQVVTDPELVIPEPPRGHNGCGWMLHPEGTSCAKDPSEHD